MGIKLVYLTGTTSHPKAKQLGVIHIHYLPLKFLCEKYDGLILTSKNAVRALELFRINWKSVPCYVIGQGTADAVKKAGGVVKFISSQGYGDEFAHEIAPLLQGKLVALVRPKEVVSDVAGILKNFNVNLDEFIGYETRCVPCDEIKKPPSASVIIFTSPSTVKCFLECFTWDASWRAVCIGYKTAAALPSYIASYTAPRQSIDACVSMAHQLYENLSKNSL